MGSEWQEITVGDLVKRGILEKPMDGNHGGIHPKGSDFVSSGVPFIMASDLIGGRVNLDNCSYITERQAKTLRKGFAKNGDILLTHKATIGRTALVQSFNHEYLVLTPQVTYYRVNNPDVLLNKYLKYYFDSKYFQDILNSWAGGGSTRAYLGITDQLKLPIRFPSLHEQKAIAHILGSLDDKIELNRQMNATLEAMAQALFKSWFVDFDPVIDNALAAGNPIPDELQAKAAARLALGNARKPLPAEIQALFPNAFVLSEEMGLIPEGWEVSTLGNEFSVEMGQSPPSTTYNQVGDGIPFFQGSTDFGFRYPENRVYCTEPKKFAKSGDTLISVRAPVGDTNIAKFDCCIGRGLSAVMHKSKSKSYTYYAINNMKTYFSSFESEGTVFGSINQKSLKNLPVLSFSKAIMEIFDIYVKALDKKIEVNSNQIENLTNLRDTLLPKLLSGELRIPEAEQLAADALN